MIQNLEAEFNSNDFSVESNLVDEITHNPQQQDIICVIF